MQTGLTDSWKDALARTAAERRVLAQRREEEWNRRRTEQREARQAREEELAEDVDIAAGAIIYATQQQITAFAERLDATEAALVDALMENEQALERARAQLDELLAGAHVLDDGRRVFATEDRTQVFDEHGTDVTDLISPDEIHPGRPSWGTFQEAASDEAALEAEHGELIDYQQRLDEMRDRLGEDGLTTDELDDMRDALEAQMPEAVRTRVDGPDPSGGPNPSPADNAQPSGTVDMDAMRRTLTGVTAGM